MKYHVIFFSALLAITACGGEKASNESSSEESSIYTPEYEKGLMDKANTFFKTLPEVAENKDNPVTDEKVKLGKILYLDTRLSKDGNNSCNSCHELDKYGVDNEITSAGDLGERGERNAPTVFNAALHTSQFWDGRAADVEEQAGMPVTNPVEMNMPGEDFVVKRLKSVPEYREMFAQAFPESDEAISFENMKMAIGAFERTLMTPSRFDDYMEGDEHALTREEKKGLYEFIDVGCITCHTGPALGGNMFQKFGVYGNYWEATGSERIDEGRYAVTGNEMEKYMFKVPSLRNVEKTYPYFHDGSVAELDKAIKIMGKMQLNKELTEEQIKSIGAFLKSLTGEVPLSAMPG